MNMLCPSLLVITVVLPVYLFSISALEQQSGGASLYTTLYWYNDNKVKLIELYVEFFDEWMEFPFWVTGLREK